MITDQRSSGSERVVPSGADAQRKRSIEDTLAASRVLGTAAAMTTDSGVNGAKKRGVQGENGAAYTTTNPLFEGNAGTHRWRNTRASLTDGELQQVLGHWAAHENGPSSRHRVTASNSGAMVVGSSNSIGSRTKRSDDMKEFMERVKQQPTATYVPIACAEKLLKQAATDAEQAESRHRDVVVKLEATYRTIDEKTKRHYEGLIFHLQSEARTELRRLTREGKDQEELVESLRDKIASLTAAAAAQERRHVAMREKDNLKREQGAADFKAMKAELVEENLRALATVAMEAKQSAERDATSRVEESRRRSMQRVELEDKAVRATVSLALEGIIRAIEDQEESQDRTTIAGRLSMVRTEADQLRTQLGEALMTLETQRGETERIIKERDDVQAESLVLKADLEEMKKIPVREFHREEETDGRRMGSNLPGAVEDERSQQAMVMAKEGDRMLDNAPPTLSQDATASAGDEEPLKGEAELTQTLAKLQKEGMRSATATEEEFKKSLQAAKDEARDAALTAKKSDLLREEASAALQATRAELLSCQLVVDEASEAARLREQVAALEGNLEAKSRDATSAWQAAATAESKIRSLLEAVAFSAATSSSIESLPPSEAVDGRTVTTSAVSADATAELTGADVAGGCRGGESAAEGDGVRDQADGGLSAGEEATRLAKDLDIAGRELENLRERERDARAEADGMTEEAERSRVRQERQREREAELISTVATLEEEKETLSRGLVMAQERAALAMELVAAHTEEAAKARQESALNAAKFRRASRELGGATAAAAVASAGAEATAPERSMRGKSPSAENRRTVEQLRLAAAILVHAIKEGTDLWRRNRREECHALYAKAGARAAGQMPPGQALDDLRVAMTAAKGMTPVKAAITLRKAFDTVIEGALAAKENLVTQKNVTRADGSNRGSRVPAGDGSAEDAGADNQPVDGSAASSGAVEATTDGSAVSAGENSKVASLQRQLESMLASQVEMDKVAALAAQGGGITADGGAVALKTSRLELTTKRCAELEGKIEDLQEECRGLREALLDAGPAVEDGAGVGGVLASQPRARADQLRISSLEKKNKEEAAKTRKLEAQVAKLEAQAATGTARGESTGSKADAAKVKALENKMKKAAEEFERKTKKVERDLEVASKGWDSCKAELSDMRKDREALQKEVAAMGSMGEELQTLRTKADEAARLKTELEEATASAGRVQKLYQDEQALRKKYWNMMEDMKGKIRVYTRCRPFAQYELNQNCKRAVRLLDDTTVEVDGHHGAKQFVFDNVFSEDHNQEAVFQETRNLVQSALDGFNICVFAYGQTGSGKTWTMTGGKGDQRGLTPRVIEEIFAIIEKGQGSTEVHVSCYFIELYLDNLRDLFFAMDHSNGTPPKLEIKLDSNKMVVVKNVVTKKVANAQELLHLFTQGNHQRKVGGTKMNAESSRSHSIFGILIEVYNRMTKKSVSGKFSLVDLAGSERAGKTGATADRLKEAQSINKSLSALGDVISALSTNEKFIPYRNNKLTQVMQDSLGGNAKTLMFVNISPADYNQEETVTALTYASRVKLITNSAEKQQDGEEVARLKETIRRLKAGDHEADETVEG